MEKKTMDEDSFHLKPKKWLEDLSHGRSGHEIEILTVQGLQVVAAQKGLIRCTFFVPKSLADRDGNWHTGAMATLMDDIGAAAIATTAGYIKASVNFDISCFSIVKVEEEVEIEAKVLSDRGKLSSVLVEVKRKDNGEMVALGKLWMTFI
ncbi:Thioesterase superfamily protein, partial [Thalictrum thalictroides]